VKAEIDLATPLTALPGVGPKMADKLSSMGLNSCQDLLFHLPLRFEDRTRITPIAELIPGTTAQVEGEVLQLQALNYRKGAIACHLTDRSGVLTLRFFHWGASLRRQMPVGARLRCFGLVRSGWKSLEMIHPSWKKIDPRHAPPLATHLTPVYPTGKGVGQTTVQRLVEWVLGKLAEFPDEVLELLPAELCASLKLPRLRDALQQAHKPTMRQAAILAGEHSPTARRLAFEELLAHQIAMRQARARMRNRRAPRLALDAALRERFLQQLGFELTGAQRRVCSEIAADLDSDHPAMRLIQGDVGCGKTVVAAHAMVQTVAAGYQAALMAPTELLAEQHYHTLQRWFAPLDLKLTWLAGSVRGRKRHAALDAIAGDAQIICGTHALLQDNVAYRALGLVVIDEQQRFGVAQRLALSNKVRGNHAESVHQLVMSATPIPRTLAMTAFADLDVSLIDEMPPGRQPVTTAALPASRRDDLLQRVQVAMQAGDQAYWVCPLIESSEQIEAEAATDIAEHLRQRLSGVAIGVAHGRQSSSEKERVMRDFKEGRIRLLVATTVIEVGVDVPQANLMIIENAERLGLAQLHQLRGRVGRGKDGGSCVLLYRAPLGAIARQRLDMLRHSSDGFAIAEKDLELRGAGELFGQRQTGVAQLRMANLARDQAMLPAVRGAADDLLRDHPRQTSALVARWLGEAARFLEA